MRYASVLLALCMATACQTKPKVTDVKPNQQNQNPKLTKPVVRRLWIQQKIEDDGRVMIDGHWRYEIERDSTWSQ